MSFIKQRAARRAFLDQARDKLDYVPAFRSLERDELDLLFELAGPGRAVVGLRRAARFLWRERHLRAVGGDGEAEALVVIALVLLRSDPVRGKARLDAGSERQHRALSAWWWSAILCGLPALHDRRKLAERVEALTHWLSQGAPEKLDPGELARARAVSIGARHGLESARYGSRNAMSRMLHSVLLRANPRDLVTGEPIEGLLLVERAHDRGPTPGLERVELHHVFPRGFLSHGPTPVPPAAQNQYANIALLSGATNGWISDRAPRLYVAELDRHFDIEHVNELMRSHLLDASLLRTNAFEEQMKIRGAALTAEVERLLDPRAVRPLSQRGSLIERQMVEGPDEAVELHGGY